MLVGVYIGTTTLESDLATSQKDKHIVNIQPVISLLGICPREVKAHVHKKTCAGMFTAALLIIAPKWKQFNWSSTGGQISSLKYITECYWGIRRHRLLTHSTAGINL